MYDIYILLQQVGMTTRTAI